MINRKITIKKNNIKSFYKVLFIYNSFIYKFVNFKLINKTDDIFINQIEDILNTKNKKQNIKKVIDYTCAYMDDYYKDKTMCDFKCSQCIIQRMKKSSYINGCCHICVYPTSNGCPSRNIACKRFNCTYVKNHNKTLKDEDLKLIYCLTPLQRFIVKSDYFTLENDVIKDIYFNSMIIASIRVISRNVYHSIKVHKDKLNIK